MEPRRVGSSFGAEDIAYSLYSITS
uniref:Uncharacterized protein n=1 Tax=Arundo donax TaxID=35708 RepID=A0A0A9AMB5_ARUDO